MTREQAIKCLKWFKEYNEEDYCGGDRIQDEHGDWYYRITEQDFEAFEMAIKALEQEPCDDCISRQFMYELGATCIATRNENGKLIALGAIETLPSVTPIRPKGHWIKPRNDDGMSDPIYYQVRCSKCGFDFDPQTWHMELHQYDADNYCPNCGVKMESEEKINE